MRRAQFGVVVRQRDTGALDKLLQPFGVDAGVAADFSEGRQRVAVSLENVLSRDSATWTAGNTVSGALDYRIGPDDHFARIDVRLLRASEFEARAAASLNRLAATVQEGRSGRSQALG